MSARLPQFVPSGPGRLAAPPAASRGRYARGGCSSHLELAQVAKACQQAPERARSCRNAITMASVMVDEIRLRAHARPLDEPEPH